jgi:hypothetical protein
MQESEGIVPKWAHTIDVHASVEYFDDEYADEMNVPSFVLPSVAQQWKDDMSRRVQNIMKAEGAESDDFRWRAPELFIKTGRWPSDVSRPETLTVSQRREHEQGKGLGH